jgi:hypothetical protein
MNLQDAKLHYSQHLPTYFGPINNKGFVSMPIKLHNIHSMMWHESCYTQWNLKKMKQNIHR